MTEKSKPQPNAGQDPDDAPDLSQAPWREKLDAAAVRVGRPEGRRCRERGKEGEGTEQREEAEGRTLNWPSSGRWFRHEL